MNVLRTFSLEGKVALVIGGSGLYGEQIVDALCEAGARTYITTSQPGKVAQLEQECQARGAAVTALYLDQTKEETIAAARDLLLAREGRIDILVNNAYARVMRGWNDDTAKFQDSVTINATGVYALTKIFGNAMQPQGSGSIIQIGSMQGMVGPDEWLYEGGLEPNTSPDYFFNKSGLINFTKYVAAYYGKYNIRCNVISPGGIQSYRTSEAFVERYSKRTLLNRMANDSDLKGIIVFLASDASAYITAANIPVDGGYTAK